MKVVVFAKKIRKHDGSSFTGYVTKLTNTKTGNDEYVRVRFNQGCSIPTELPAVIIVKKANLSHRAVTLKDGTEIDQKTLWIAAWDPSGETYEDHSLDDYQ